MNRRERRKTAKRLGIMQYQKKLPRDAKFNLIRENLIAGKQTHEEFVRKSKLTQDELVEEQKAQRIYALAEKISAGEQISYVDAIEKAKLQLQQQENI